MKNITHDWHLIQQLNENWVYADNIFTSEECKGIIDNFKNKIETGNIAEQEKLKEIRQSKIHFINSNDLSNHWIFEKITDVVLFLNQQYFNFEIEKIETLQFSEYDESYKGFYEKHIDIIHRSANFRKLSFTILLSEPEDYDGGELLLHYDIEPAKTKQAQGGIVMFPSYTLHEVSPVTKGTRYALVGWVCGPKFK